MRHHPRPFKRSTYARRLASAAATASTLGLGLALRLGLGLGLGLGLLATPASAAETRAPALPLAISASAADAALQLFNRAAAGQDAVLDQALLQWQALAAADPGNPAPRAYLGALTSMQARATWLPWRKISYADDGLALIDKALAQLSPAHDRLQFLGVPISLQLRWVAASTFNSLPALFNRADRGARLMDDLLKSPLLVTAPACFKAAVWLSAGKGAAKAGRLEEARQWLGKAAASGAPQAAEAQLRLKAI